MSHFFAAPLWVGRGVAAGRTPSGGRLPQWHTKGVSKRREFVEISHAMEGLPRSLRGKIMEAARAFQAAIGSSAPPPCSLIPGRL